MVTATAAVVSTATTAVVTASVVSTAAVVTAVVVTSAVVSAAVVSTATAAAVVTARLVRPPEITISINRTLTMIIPHPMITRILSLRLTLTYPATLLQTRAIRRIKTRRIITPRILHAVILRILRRHSLHTILTTLRLNVRARIWIPCIAHG